MASNKGNEDNLGDSPKKREMIRYDEEEYALRKRLPRCLPKTRNDIYINMKTNVIGQMKRCEKLLDSGENEICIHGLGMAVNRAVHIALQLQAKYLDTLQVSPCVSTVDLIDDFEPLNDDGDYFTQTRKNSVIHIKLFRPTPLVEIPSSST